MRPSFLRMRFLGFTGALALLLALQTSYAIAASYLPGKVVRADLLTSDLTKAAQFYQQVFNWQLQEHKSDGYIEAKFDNRSIARFVSYAEANVPKNAAFWLISISVEDVDQAVLTAKKQGGKVLEAAQEAPGVGRAAVLKDNAGAIFMVVRNADGDPADSEAQNNEWLWPELWTDNPKKAAAFYQKLAGYSAKKHRQGDNEYLILGREGIGRASILRTPLPGVEPNWLLYMKVDSVDRVARAVLKHGGEILLPPTKEDNNGYVAIVADPTGGVFALQSGGDQ